MSAENATEGEMAMGGHNNVTSILGGVEQASLEAFAAFHEAVLGNMNVTLFDTILDFNAISEKYAAEANATDVNGIIKALQGDHVLYETYSFFDLFFGANGIFSRQ